MPSSGFLLVDKPAGITSHDVVDRLRRVTGVQRIGHSGTLDPFATGLLIVGVGRESTRHLDRFLKMDKQYRAVLHLGATSTTGDRTGKITPNSIIPANAGIQTQEESGFRVKPGMTIVKNVLQTFVGVTSQVPPMYSAKKVGGKKLYELARAGKTIERKPISIAIASLRLVSYSWPLLTLDIHCSSGTYIRTLGEDIGSALGCGAYAQELMRTAIGPYRLQDAVELSKITGENWQRMASAVSAKKVF